MVAKEPALEAGFMAPVLDVSMLLAMTVLRLPPRPPWLTYTESVVEAAMAPSYLQTGSSTCLKAEPFEA